MSPAPDNHDSARRFDPRSEAFLESLRNLIEFKIRRENFDANSVEIHHLYSRSMVDALDCATNELEGDGWYIMSISRIWDEEPMTVTSQSDDTVEDSDIDGFVTMMRGIFEAPDKEGEIES